MDPVTATLVILVLAVIAFVSNRDGNPEIYVINADGTNPVRLTNLSTLEWGPAWSPDGKSIFFPVCTNVDYGVGCEIFVAPTTAQAP